MCDSDTISRLYASVLHEDILKYQITDADIRTGIQNMKEVYLPNPASLSSAYLDIANYDDPAHRCAYLHKYAPFHTALVAAMLQRAILENPKVFADMLGSGDLKICSLGGGPGSDVIGVMSVLNAACGFFQVSATIVDCMTNWRQTFASVVQELRYGTMYGSLGACVSDQYFSWNYLQSNLLGAMSNEVNKAISTANLVTMIKFVSASACKDTSAMIKMYDSEIIIRLYETVLREKRLKFRVESEEFRNAVDEIQRAYAPSTDITYVDYNNPGNRCAYLYKYAPFHTALVAFMLEIAIDGNPEVFLSMDSIELCSLGGGPGSDVIGVLAALSNLNPCFSISANILDCMKEWKETFNTLIQEIGEVKEYGLLSHSVSLQKYDWKNYIEIDLYKIDDKACRAIASANLITMVKFVSAAAGGELRQMIRKIFSHVKPGALILYIDNDSFKLHSILGKEAKRHKLEVVIPPFEHKIFTDSAFKKHKLGFTACYKTRVAVYLWKKPLTNSDNLKTSQPRSIKVTKSKSVKLKKSTKDIYRNQKIAKIESTLHDNPNNFYNQSNRIQYTQGSMQENLNLSLPVNHSSYDQSNRIQDTQASMQENLNLSLPVNHLGSDQYSSNNSVDIAELHDNVNEPQTKNTSKSQKSIQQKILEISISSVTTLLGIEISELFWSSTTFLLEDAFNENNSIIDTDEFMNYLFYRFII